MTTTITPIAEIADPRGCGITVDVVPGACPVILEIDDAALGAGGEPVSVHLALPQVEALVAALQAARAHALGLTIPPVPAQDAVIVGRLVRDVDERRYAMTDPTGRVLYTFAMHEERRDIIRRLAREGLVLREDGSVRRLAG